MATRLIAAVHSIDEAQQAHVHRTQKAGQPLSGADSLASIGHVSGTSSELKPLASDIRTATTAINKARASRSIYQSARSRVWIDWPPDLTPLNASSILGTWWASSGGGRPLWRC